MTAPRKKRREAFLGIAAAEPERCRVIDALRSQEVIAADVLAAVEPLLASLPAARHTETEAAQ